MKLADFFQIIQFENTLENRKEIVDIVSFEMYPAYIKKNSVYFHWVVGKDSKRILELALQKGAYVVTSDTGYKNSLNPQIIYVGSVSRALKALALYQRKNYQGEVIAITGSIGKSSVKNMLSQVLAMKHVTLSTIGNENAWLGIYCTLSNIRPDTQYIVLETGASGPKSLSVPIQVVKPTIAVLLDVNFSHQEKYASFEDLLLEKASIIDSLVENGRLFISYNTYQQLLQHNYCFRADIKIHTIAEASDQQVDFKIENIHIDIHATTITVHSDLMENISLQQSNTANAINAVYSWAVLKSIGMPLNQFNSLIRFYKPLPRRFERLRICQKNGQVFELIDDAYNSSPLSALSAIQSLEIRKPRRKILVFADMLELGEKSFELHQALFEESTFKQFDHIVILGEISQSCQLPFKATHAGSIDEILEILTQQILSGDLLLLKGSNGMNLFLLRKKLEALAIHVSSSNFWCIEDEYSLNESSSAD